MMCLFVSYTVSRGPRQLAVAPRRRARSARCPSHLPRTPARVAGGPIGSSPYRPARRKKRRRRFQFSRPGPRRHGVVRLRQRLGQVVGPEAAQDVDRGPVVEAQRLAGAADDEEARRADAPAAHGSAPPPVDCTGSGLLRGGLHVVVHVLPHGSLARGRLAERAREAHAHGLRPRQLQHQNHALPEAALLREAVVVPRHEQAPSSQILPHVLRARRRERERRVADVARRRPRRAAARALWRAPRDRRQGPGVVAADLPLPPPQTPDVDPLQRAVALARRNHRFRPRLFIRTLAAVRRVGLGETDAARRLPRLGARRRDHRFRRRRR
mmetsp:Transcript_11748/g.34697  ORF Transcript_11748/g.34697 Transcript_11748/m.34697 type:complete len:326 (+) Transcript_11748:1020-1997(+)